MSGFIEGESRTQVTLFPDQLDDYITEENSARVIDVFIDGLNLFGLGCKSEPAVTGRPAYHPGTLLKLFINGYLNRVQSSRRLEREAGRNVELMWLLGRWHRTSKRLLTLERIILRPLLRFAENL